MQKPTNTSNNQKRKYIYVKFGSDKKLKTSLFILMLVKKVGMIFTIIYENLRIT
jgi:hypothetical protein